MKKLIFIILAGILFNGPLKAQEPFKIYGKYMVNVGSVLGAKIKIEKNGVQVKLLEQDKSKFEFPLEYDCDYVLSNPYIREKGKITNSIIIFFKHIKIYINIIDINYIIFHINYNTIIFSIF